MLRKLLICIVFLPNISGAQCLTASTGAGCSSARIVVAPPSTNSGNVLGPGPVEIGTILPKGEYSMLMNATWYGLPQAKDGWVYFRIEDDVYRVDLQTREVLERATSEVGRNWP